jgi:hypothetical protein
METEAMQLDRRALLISFAGSAALLALPRGAAGAFEAECFAAARKDDRGNYSAALFSLTSGDVRTVELPGRGHDIALKPDGSEWVTFARRPGRFGVAIRLDARPPAWFATKPDRHFFGHGAFSANGKLLYSTENDYEGARGVIGVRDATDSYKQIGEFSAHGVEPHDIQLLADGRTMVIANGGIRTSPDNEGELNLPDMQPSLVYVDVETGDLLEEQRLEASLHQLSIRHLATAAGDTIAFGCQYRGPEQDAPPLVGFHRRGEKLVIVPAPEATQVGLRNYIGSVAADAGGGIIAASAPKGGVVTYWDVASRRYLGASDLNDGCGLAPTHRSASFLLTSGEGWLVTADAEGEATRQSSHYSWDNHAILVR